MNKEVVRVTSFVAGIIAAATALLFAVSGIIQFTKFNGMASTNYNIYVGISAALFIAFAAILGILAYRIIKKYISKSEEEKDEKFPVLAYTAYEFISSLTVMIIFTFLDDVRLWVVIVLSVIAFVLMLLRVLGKLEEKISGIINLVGIGIAFITLAVSLSAVHGIVLVSYIFMMFTTIAIFLYYLFKMIVNE